MKKLIMFIIVFLAFGLISGCETPSDNPITEEKAMEAIENAFAQISISDEIEGDVSRIILPNNKKDVYFEWTSSDETIINKSGYVTHDLLFDQTVTLTVTAEYKGYFNHKDFEIIVKNTTADTIVEELLAKVKLPASISEDLTLIDSLTYGEEEFELTWESNNQDLLTNDGEFKATSIANVDLVARINLNGETYERTFTLEVYPRTHYEIVTVEDFSDINDDLDGLYYLMNDLDFDSLVVPVIGSLEHPFTGIFRGQGHKLNNVNLTLDDNASGIFAVNEGLIEKVALLNFNITGTIQTQGFVGGLIGLNRGLVDQCHLDGKMTLTVNRLDTVSLGGFVGEMVDGEITNCVSSILLDLTLTSENETTLAVGGFVGKATGGVIRHSIYEDQPNYNRNPKGRSILVKNANDNTIFGGLFVGSIEDDGLFDHSFAVGALEVKDYDLEGTNPQSLDNFAGKSVTYAAFENCYVLDTCLVAGRETKTTCNQMSTSTMVTEDWYNNTLHFEAALWDYSTIYTYNAAVARLQIFN